MGFVFAICVVVMYFISIYETRNGVNPKSLEIDKSMFKTAPGFTVGALIVLGLIVALYSIYW
jgi:SSS family solute:Na+ symporter